MTSLADRTTTTTLATSTAAGPAYAPLRRPAAALGAAALLLAPLLIVGGELTSPPQDSGAPADYISSLARDPFLSSASATLLHYGWVAMALGLLAALGLIRGRRGRVLALIGGVGGAISSIQISGMLLSDWYLSALGNTVSSEQAVAVFIGMQDTSVDIWLASGQAAIVLPVLLFAGLARAGVISWWLVPLALFPMIAPYALSGLVGGGTLGLAVTALSGLACFAPAFVTGARLLGRARLTTEV